MEHYSKIRDDAFKMTHSMLMENISDSDLIKCAQAVKDSPNDSFGYIKGLRQETVAKLFPLIADGSWKVKETYYCSEGSFDIIKMAPEFLNVESYNAWRELKKKYPHGFDANKGGREAWKEYGDKYPDFWGDARMLDGHAEYRFGCIYVAPNIVPKRYERDNHKSIQEDELFLVVYDDACREGVKIDCPYCSECDTYNEHSKEINTNPGMCFVLTPNKETFEERRLEIYKYFKSHIISAYVKFLMRKHDEEEAKRWENELIEISNGLLNKTV